MDPVTHSLTGAVLSRAGLNRATPLATATLVLGANAPDIDGIIMLQGTYAALAARRGLTHGPLALLLLPFVVAGVVLLYDRAWRRRRTPTASASRPLTVLGLAFVGVLTHAPLDWMNTYGIRLLMPFSERWFYGDALFIIDPWIWLLLAAPLVGLAVSRRGRTAWVLLGIAATLMVLLAPQVPLVARGVWVLAITAIAVRTAVAWRRPRDHAAADGSGGRRGRAGAAVARVALAGMALYIAGMVAADRLGRRETGRAAAAAGFTVESLMVAPVPANPFAADLVVDSPDEYRLGRLDWFASPRVRWADSIPKGERTPEVLATLQLQQVRDFLRWSRYPYVEQRAVEDGHIVRFGDARYPTGRRGGLSGVVVHVEGSLQARPLD
jgi:inner membrane protein